jgi:two-component system NarL family sensor kinase
MIETDGKQRKGSGALAVEFAARGAKGPVARKTPRRPKARRTTRPARAGESAATATTLERPRGHIAERADATVADLLARERRRTAADVHDLIMQDLSLALATARMLADDPAQAAHASIVVAACERALAGARSTVDSLLAHGARPVIDAVGQAARAASRLVPVSFVAEGVSAGVQPDQPTLDALVHVAREAVTNAVKHAAPSAVEVVLEYGEQWRLRVRDDGHGFDSTCAQRGFGLNSMSAHAQTLGGTLRVSSAADTGTTVEAILP